VAEAGLGQQDALVMVRRRVAGQPQDRAQPGAGIAVNSRQFARHGIDHDNLAPEHVRVERKIFFVGGAGGQPVPETQARGFHHASVYGVDVGPTDVESVGEDFRVDGGRRERDVPDPSPRDRPPVREPLAAHGSKFLFQRNKDIFFMHSIPLNHSTT